MPREQSAGAVIYFQDKKKIEYLMLQYRHLRWDFPRGHVESGESIEEAAKREIFEETGLGTLEFIAGFKEVVSWFYHKKDQPKANYKEIVYFLTRSANTAVVLDDENLMFKWLSYEEAIALPMFPHVKKVLDKANGFLASYNAK